MRPTDALPGAGIFLNVIIQSQETHDCWLRVNSLFKMCGGERERGFAEKLIIILFLLFASGSGEEIMSGRLYLKRCQPKC